MSLSPLYLAVGHAWRVELDGEALHVDSTRRASMRYPLRRLSRVVSGHDATWSTEALLACMDAGVAVQFIDAHGQLRACCYGMRQREATLACLLENALDDPDWERLYGTWYRGMETQLVRDALLRAGLRPHHLDASGARSDLCNACRDRLGVGIGTYSRHLQGVVHAWVAESLGRAIDAPHLLGYPRPGLCLVSDFAALMQWTALASTLALEPDRLAAIPLPRLAAEQVQQFQPVLERVLDRVLERFSQWLRGWAQ